MSRLLSRTRKVDLTPARADLSPYLILCSKASQSIKRHRESFIYPSCSCTVCISDWKTDKNFVWPSYAEKNKWNKSEWPQVQIKQVENDIWCSTHIHVECFWSQWSKYAGVQWVEWGQCCQKHQIVTFVKFPTELDMCKYTLCKHTWFVLFQMFLTKCTTVYRCGVGAPRCVPQYSAVCRCARLCAVVWPSGQCAPVALMCLVVCPSILLCAIVCLVFRCVLPLRWCASFVLSCVLCSELGVTSWKQALNEITASIESTGSSGIFHLSVHVTGVQPKSARRGCYILR